MPTPASASNRNRNNNNNNNNNATAPRIESAAGFVTSDARMEQILDDADHVEVTHQNQRSLVAETVANLRALTKDVAADNWMFAEASAASANSGSKGSRSGRPHNPTVSNVMTVLPECYME
jgi:hypothetical protein